MQTKHYQKAIAIVLLLLTAACSETHEPTGMAAKAASALQDRASRIDQALKEAGA